ncbi:MAG: MFS transporter [Parachlamydiaceae bacterium]
MNSSMRGLSKWCMLLGNVFEHYDAALFTLLSPLLAPLFFPNHDPLSAIILTYCIIPLGMIARPLGSLVFGYIGDRKGVQEALVLSLSGMGIITGGMAFLPTYQQAGIFAPILLSLSRILQNFFAAGETMGGAIYLIENSCESKKNIMSGLYGSSTIAGILLASMAISLLYAFDIAEKGWRYLYFFGSFTAACVSFLRTKIAFKKILVDLSAKKSFSSVFSTCLNHYRALISIAIASGFSYASYTISLVMMNSFAPLVAPVSPQHMMHVNTFLLGIDFLLLPLFGFVANHLSRERMMSASGIFALLTGLPLLWLLEGASLLTIIFIRLIFVIIGIWFSAPFYAWSQTLVPASDRYTVISFGYAIGSQILGGPAAAISLWLFQKTGWVGSVGLYWMFLGLIASYCISRQTHLCKQYASCLR